MTAPTQAPPSTGGEPNNEFKRELIKQATRFACRANRPFKAVAIEKRAFEKGGLAAHKLLAAAPTGYVPVKRELLADAALYLELDIDKDARRIGNDLRALLSPAPKDEAK